MLLNGRKWVWPGNQRRRDGAIARCAINSPTARAAAAASGIATSQGWRSGRLRSERGARRSRFGRFECSGRHFTSRSIRSQFLRWRARACPCFASAASHCDKSSCSEADRPRSRRNTQEAASCSAGSKLLSGSGGNFTNAPFFRSAQKIRRFSAGQSFPALRLCVLKFRARSPHLFATFHRSYGG